jgi:hypothetical protein
LSLCESLSQYSYPIVARRYLNVPEITGYILLILLTTKTIETFRECPRVLTCSEILPN